jgi:hypothetical protein
VHRRPQGDQPGSDIGISRTASSGATGLRLIRWEGYDSRPQEVDLWVWGLPPPGPLAFVCEWPAPNIPETRAEMEAGLVLGAGCAVAIWPDDN